MTGPGPRRYDESLWDAIKRITFGHDSRLDTPEVNMGGMNFPATGPSATIPVGGIGAGARAALGAGSGVTRYSAGTARGLPSGLGAEVIGVSRNARTAVGGGSRTASRGGGGALPRGTANSRRNAPINIRGGGTQVRPPMKTSMMPSGKQIAAGTGFTVAAGAASNRFQDMHAAREQRAQETRDSRRNHPQPRAAPQGNEPANSFTDELGLGLWAQGHEQNQSAPSDEFNSQQWLDEQLAQLAGSYDAQIEALGGLSDVYRSNADQAQENIGDFFGYASNVAREGMPVTEEVYDTAQQNVGNIYGELDSRLESMPANLTNIATDAAGGAVASSVAGRVAEATAPFSAASATSRANAQANLTQHSSAGQSYLNNLASAAPAEGALHQSSVEQALGQQQQLVAYRQAELEGAKQRAMMEMAADISGSSSEQMANMALAQALGLDHLPGNVSPMDYLRAQNMMEGNEVDTIKQQRDLIGLQQAEHNLIESQNPDILFDQAMSQLDRPSQEAFNTIRMSAEREASNLSMDGAASPRAVATQMLLQIDEAIDNDSFEDIGLVAGVHSRDHQESTARHMQEIIRRLLA